MLLVAIGTNPDASNDDNGGYDVDDDNDGDDDDDGPCHGLNAQVVRVNLDNQAGHEAGVEVTIPRCK